MSRQLQLPGRSLFPRTPARGLALVLPPGTGTGARRVSARTALVASLTEGGRAALGASRGAARLGPRQRKERNGAAAFHLQRAR